MNRSPTAQIIEKAIFDIQALAQGLNAADMDKPNTDL